MNSCTCHILPPVKSLGEGANLRDPEVDLPEKGAFSFPKPKTQIRKFPYPIRAIA